MTTPPNIVVIMTDTQDIRLVSAYGARGADTPCLDRLAATGVRFERCYTTSPVCTPARAGLFTGLPPTLAGPYTNCLPLGEGVQHLGHRFRDLGYATGYAGKWHLDGHDYFGTGVCPEGWDPELWFDGRDYLDSIGPEATKLWRQGLWGVEALRKHNVTSEFCWAHCVVDRCIEWLPTHQDKPFLMVASFDEPHAPFTCPPEYVEKYIDRDFDYGPGFNDTLDNKPLHHKLWSGGPLSTPMGAAHRAQYLGCNEYVDSQVGRLVEEIESRYPNTWIIYTSDHGDFMGARGLQGKGPAMYDEITRVPLIVRGPGCAAGKVDPTVVQHMDVMPTLLRLVGAEVPESLVGNDLSAHFRGTAGAEPGEAMLEFNRFEVNHDGFGGFQPIRCLVQGHWKLVINLLTSDELYNLRDDPGELKNLIDSAEHVETRDRLHDRLLDRMNEVRDAWRGWAWERRPWRSSKLRLSPWGGKCRPHPADTHKAEYRDYDTGSRTRGVHAEYTSTDAAD
ncbi:sulfatase-like hydrolase/transferase [Variovorax robiniae]|uniref:Sulfatase-like hydrolase/transferase n=1 Tax=Variovorax robiniae TaxID=1836199 RepID=A0ABU8X7F8_9BURK